MEKNVFLTDFSIGLEQSLTNNPLHQARLKYVYQQAENILVYNGWQDLTLIESPCILLCGTASPTTTNEYISFLLQLNNNTTLIPMDLSMHPLIQQPIGQEVRADALQMPYAESSFDRIETDRFLQFFNNTSLKTLFNEWHRILKPNGVITTRDHIIQTNVDYYLGKVIRELIHSMGLPNYELNSVELQDLLKDAGFQSTIKRFKVGNASIPLLTTLVAKKI